MSTSPYIQPETTAIDFRVVHHNSTEGLSNVCLFSSYSFGGIVEEYVYYYLQALRNAGWSIAFISTSPVSESCSQRLSALCFLIIEKENRCPDFGSWMIGLSVLDWGKDLESVLMVNDSVFGPFYDLANIISSMNQHYDVWGMSSSYEISFHLQSYFLHFNKKAVNSNTFTSFWKQINLTATKDEVIGQYEIGLAALFQKNNFSIGSYANVEIIKNNPHPEHKQINPILVFWKKLVTENQFPFLKRELLIKGQIAHTYWPLDIPIALTGWRKTIIDNTPYPISYIDAFINSYAGFLNKTSEDLVLQQRKLLLIIHSAENGPSQQQCIQLLQYLHNNTSLQAELIVCNSSNNQLEQQLMELCPVTYLDTLSAESLQLMKKRLVNDTRLIFSFTLENIITQKFLSILHVPQLIYAHEPVKVLQDSISSENASWLADNIEQLLCSNREVYNYLISIGIPAGKVVTPAETGIASADVTIENPTQAFRSPALLQLITTYFDENERAFLEQPVVTFITHLYYENSWEEIRRKLKNFDNGKNHFLFSISEACMSKEEIVEDIRQKFIKSHVIISSNIGKDIGGKMALIDIYLLLDIPSPYIVMLHDKQSPHSAQGDIWKKELFVVIDYNYQKFITEQFRRPETGIVGSKNYIVNEYNPVTNSFVNNNTLSKKLLQQYDMSLPDYDFLGGTMYWIRSSIIKNFFGKHSPISTRANLEAGNVMDLYGERLAHTWERMFSWIATSQGYKIKGI